MTARVRTRRGFTLVELMVVVAIIAILALIALPSYQNRIVGEQVVEGVKGADFVRKAVAEHHARLGTLPADNAAAGLPAPGRIVGSYVRGVAVSDGAITITFGNSASRVIHGKQLVLRAAVVEGEPRVPIAWVCAAAAVPQGMQVHGSDTTSLPSAYLPLNCRPGS